MVNTIGICLSGNDSEIRNVAVLRTKGGCIAVSGHAQYLNNVYTEYSDRYGINIVDADDCSCIQCYSSLNGQYGFCIQGETHHNIFVDCKADRNGMDGIILSSTGGTTRNNIFVGCSIYLNDEHGVWFHGSRNNLFEGCQITDNSCSATNTHDGVYLETNGAVSSTNNIISGCIFDSSVAEKHRYCIHEVDANQDYNIFTGNQLHDATTGQILKSGVNSICHHNIGWKTENSGTATILNTGTDIVVPHGLDGTPTIINVTGQHTEVLDIYVDTIGAANFTIHTIGGNVTANRDIFWEAKVR